MKLSADSVEKFSFADVTGYGYPVAGKDFSLSRLIVEGKGRPPQPEDLKHRFVFYIEQGHGRFIIGEESIDVTARDLVQVPFETSYQYEGTMIMLEFMMPAWSGQ